MIYIRKSQLIFLLIINKTNKIRKSDLLLIDLAPGGPGKCSALKRGSCQGRSPVFMKNILIEGKKGRSSCDNHNDFILFSSQVLHQIPVNWTFNMIDCQYDYRAFPADATCWLWIPTKN